MHDGKREDSCPQVGYLEAFSDTSCPSSGPRLPMTIRVAWTVLFGPGCTSVGQCPRQVRWVVHTALAEVLVGIL